MTGAGRRRPETIHDAAFAEVQAKRLTTREAEAQARARGAPLPISDPDPVGLPRHRWRLASALLWIAWRDAGRVAAELPRLAQWGELMRYEVDEGQEMPLDRAERELADALQALPSLAAAGVLPGGEGCGAIPPEAWPELIFGPLGEDRTSTFWSEPRWEAVRVSADAVRREWPAPDDVQMRAAPVSVSTSWRAGRSVYATVVSALRDLYPGGRPKLQREEIRREVDEMLRARGHESCALRTLERALNSAWPPN